MNRTDIGPSGDLVGPSTESLMDETLAEPFPASDPPAWIREHI